MANSHVSSESDYQLLTGGEFLIRQYNQKKPFSNFLPGIAGIYGTPMWVFYVSRGQGIVSFGCKNKDQAYLEFYPANKAYQMATSHGFRTFVKIQKSQSEPSIKYEPFKEPWNDLQKTTQAMLISSNELEIVETNVLLGLEFRVRYFTVPGESLAVLARELQIKNISKHAMRLELVDGLPQVNPYGMNEFFIKNMSRTIEAWMCAENTDKNAPYLRLKVDATDRPEVTFIPEGHFFFGYLGPSRKGAELLPAIVDPAVLFGSLLDFNRPKEFFDTDSFHKRRNEQVKENKTPCAFLSASFKLNAGQAKSLQAFYGKANSLEELNRYTQAARKADYFEGKRQENKKLIESIKSRLFTLSGKSIFDQYSGQTYLDNIMRGGMPIAVDPKQVFYVYSRKHGDLERDYNQFLVDPTFFSQGNGNYRDVNQNRRSDVWLDPRVRDLNIAYFMNLLQLDGFNPLVVRGTRFILKQNPEARKVVHKYFGSKISDAVLGRMKKAFSPGELYRFLEETASITSSKFAKFFSEASAYFVREDQADHGEGFWVDHWTYNLDLIEAYAAIYPENLKHLLFEKNEYTFYDNDHAVRPRAEKYYADKKGIRQYQSVYQDKEKKQLLQSRQSHPNVVRTRYGKGDIYKTTLFAKLLTLFVNKLASLDPFGRGIEMEADKPSWYDALNGLPGLIGSSLCETFELKRLAVFMIHAIEDHQADLNGELELPEEVYDFAQKINRLLDEFLKGQKKMPAYLFWDRATTAKEAYRALTRMGVSGKGKSIRFGELKNFLEHAREKIELGIDQSFDANSKLYPTYFINEAERFSGTRPVRVTSFRQHALPMFLEGPVHAMKVERDPEKKKSLLRAVRQSPLYDQKLSMYKVNAPLKSASYEIGRARVFTPGWLENESIWLHMEYKFILELLKNGMTEEFYKDIQKALICFQPPARYGRSLTENSSFIVSSAFTDPELHGTGFVARLSGSTAEFIQMWLLMTVGKRPFFLGPDGKLSLRFEPHLSADLFTKEESQAIYTNPDGEEIKIRIPKDAFAFLFLGKTLVVYHNRKQLDTFGKMRVAVKKISFKNSRGEAVEFRQDVVPSPYSQKIRDEFISRIDIELG